MKTSQHTIQSPVIPVALQEKFLEFITHCPACRFNRNLRTMLLEFLMSSGTEAPYIKDLLLDLESLFDLLDKIEDTPSSLVYKNQAWTHLKRKGRSDYLSEGSTKNRESVRVSVRAK